MQHQPNTKTIDDLERERLFAQQSFTFLDYDRAVCDRKHHLKQLSEGKGPVWNSYDGKLYTDPLAVQLACIYDMLRHLMAKSATTVHDLNTAAFIEHHWDLAVSEAGTWKFAKKRKYTEEELLRDR